MLELITNLKVGSILSKATTQTSGVGITSGCKFNGKYLATTPTGLIQFGGDTFAGTEIESYFEPVTTDFGISNLKRLRYVYIGFESDGDLLLRITADSQTMREYTISPSKTGQQKIRVTIGRDSKGRYWNFQFRNISGCDFSIDSVEVLPITLTHGFNSY